MTRRRVHPHQDPRPARRGLQPDQTGRRVARRDQDGFTLVEVVVAIGLLAVVMTLVYSAFARSLDVTRETAEATQRVRQIQLITERLVDELSAAYWFPPTAAQPAREGRGRFVGRKETAPDSDLRRDRLMWTTFAHRRYVGNQPESDTSEVEYRLEVDADRPAGRLVRQERINLFTDAAWAVETDEMALDVTEFQLRYHSAGEWTDEWDAGERQGLPAAVEVTVGLAAVGSAPPDRIRTVVPLPLALR